MRLEARKITIGKSLPQLSHILEDPCNYKDLMPGNVVSFQNNGDGFSVQLEGLPRIELKIERSTNREVNLRASKPLQFSLQALMDPVGEDKTEVQLSFQGELNPFTRMLVEKPLKSFMEDLVDKMESL